MTDKTQKQIDKAVDALLAVPEPTEHNRVIPTKEDLDKKYVMRLDRNRKPKMIEVE